MRLRQEKRIRTSPMRSGLRQAGFAISGIAVMLVGSTLILTLRLAPHAPNSSPKPTWNIGCWKPDMSRGGIQ